MGFVVAPDWRELVADCLARCEGSEIVGRDGSCRASFLFVFHEAGWLVMVEPLESQERYWLSQPALGEELVQVVHGGEPYSYPRRFLVDAESVWRAADYFCSSGRCVPQMNWMEEEQILTKYSLLDS